MEGFLISPGSIDLGALRFWASERDLDDAKLPQHDGEDEEKKQKPESEGGGRELRQLNSTFDSVMEGSIVDIAVFLLVSVTHILSGLRLWPKLVSTIASKTAIFLCQHQEGM